MTPSCWYIKFKEGGGYVPGPLLPGALSNMGRRFMLWNKNVAMGESAFNLQLHTLPGSGGVVIAETNKAENRFTASPKPYMLSSVTGYWNKSNIWQRLEPPFSDAICVE